VILSVTVGTCTQYVEASIDTDDDTNLTPELADHYLGRCRQQAMVAHAQLVDDDAEAE